MRFRKITYNNDECATESLLLDTISEVYDDLTLESKEDLVKLLKTSGVSKEEINGLHNRTIISRFAKDNLPKTKLKKILDYGENTYEDVIIDIWKHLNKTQKEQLIGLVENTTTMSRDTVKNLKAINDIDNFFETAQKVKDEPKIKRGKEINRAIKKKFPAPENRESLRDFLGMNDKEETNSSQ